MIPVAGAVIICRINIEKKRVGLKIAFPLLVGDCATGALRRNCAEMYCYVRKL